MSSPKKSPVKSAAPIERPPEKFPIFKVCLIGSQGVGKTSMIHTLKDGKYSQTVPTIGFETIDVIVPF